MFLSKRVVASFWVFEEGKAWKRFGNSSKLL